jgi:hypothetical protein
MAQTYRQYLQNVADTTTGTRNQEARALLASVGDDGVINPAFSGQQVVNGQYNAGSSVSNYNPDTGHVNIDGIGYGPQGVAAINDIYAKEFTASNPTASIITGGGGAAGPTRAQTDPLLASLASLDTILSNKNRQSDDEHTKAIQSYDAQDAIDKQAYDKNVFSNESALTSNNQAALLNAANGSSGLRGVLASLGGLAGSGVDVIKRLVGLAANSDTGAARKTFEVNSDNLAGSWGQAERDQRQRRSEADSTLANNKQNNEANVLTSRQGIFQQLANMFGAGTGEGNTYAGKASELAAPIAATTRATVAPYAKASSMFSPGAMQDYLAGTKNLNVNTAGGDSGAVPINSPAYSSSKKKDTLSGVA